jgi:5-oxoprolinase (ATP-hydrolysing) subunit A
VATVDLNADMGESFGAYRLGSDENMLRLVTSANIACGFHGGDPLVMHRTLSLAKEHGVGVGAHPSFLDPWGFGRRMIQGERPADIEKMLIYQIGAIQGMARALGHAVGHCKMHGTLANMAETDPDLAEACARAVKTMDPDMILVVLPGQELERAGEKLGLRLAREAYADRAYDDRGCLVPRSVEGAVIHAPEVAVPRAVRMIEESAVTCVSGKRIPVAIDTVCVHGDNPGAVAMAKQIRSALEEAGIAVRPMASFVA